MGSFFKSFFASLFALVVFSLLVVFLLVKLASGIAAKDKIIVDKNSVLVIDLGQLYKEQMQQNPLATLSGDDDKTIPGLYDLVRLIRYAKTDSRIKGIYLKAQASQNGFAASEEIRKALLDFKQSGKFIFAFADVITQRTYYIANVADKIYTSPQGGLEWTGFSVDYMFLKGALDKLEIEPQIFYAGKFKSATEPLRTDKMTDANRLQTTVWLNDLYTDLLEKTAAARKKDTAELRQLANSGVIQTAQDAVDHQLLDGVRYDDEVKDEMKAKLKVDKYERISFININSYMAAASYIRGGKEKIALIYAEGDIVDGKADQGSIGSENYRNLIRKARLDRSVKAIVFRINSGGGSSMASENIWRELALAKEEKPVIVSFGDVAASGGYYIAMGADSIFAERTTITGSIGVFGIIPNMQNFFKNKLGVTFDGVKTGEYAGAMSVTHPLNEKEKKMMQADIERIYSLFKKRVADGRRIDTAYVDSIAQGRVWTGFRGKELGLIDRFGGIDDAIKSAAAKAKITDYYVREYPETQNFLEKLFSKATPMSFDAKLKEEMGEDGYKVYLQLKKIKQLTGTVQAKLPFEFFIH